ncbi:hypothetical protein MUP95_00455 [bacterium]|nr:hypothetical protein [bacterium]
MGKKNRHYYILKLIELTNVRSQQDLLDELEKKEVFISQSTLSKDLKELGVIKVRGKEGRFKFVQTTEQDTFHVSVMLKKELANFMRDCIAVNNLILVKTVPGNASGTSKCLDEIGWPEVVGTLASVDTVLIITKTSAHASEIVKRIQDIVVVK